MADARELKQAFLEALEEYQAAKVTSGPSTAPAGAAGTGIAGAIRKEGAALVDAAGGAAKGLANLGVAIGRGGASFEDVSKALGNFGSAGSLAGTAAMGLSRAFGGLSGNIGENLDTWRELSKVGASFGNDIFEMKTQASDARLSLKEFQSVINGNIKSLAGLGGSVAEGTKFLSQFSKDFAEAGNVETLTQMGMTTKEINDLLAANLTNRRKTDLADSFSRRELMESTMRLAEGMDEVSRITGKSREQQVKDLAKSNEDGRTQAAIMLMIQNGGVGVREAFDQVKVAAQAGGEVFESVAKDIIASGKPSKANRRAFAEMGSEAQRLLFEARAATMAGDKERAKQLTEDALAARSTFQTSRAGLALATQSAKSTMATQIGQDANRRRAVEEFGGDIEKMNKALAKERAGAETPGASITKFAVGLENVGRQMTTAINNEIIKPLVEDLGPRLRKMNQSLGFEPKTLTDETGAPRKETAKEKADRQAEAATIVEKKLTPGIEFERIKSDLPRSIRDALVDSKLKDKEDYGLVRPQIEKLISMSKGDLTQDYVIKELQRMSKEQGKTVGDIVKEAMQGRTGKEAGENLSRLNQQLYSAVPENVRRYQESGRKPDPMILEEVRKAAGGTPGGSLLGQGINQVRTEAVGAIDLISKGLNLLLTQTPGRATGSLGVGKLIEDFGKETLVKLHGREAVLTESQLMNLAKGAQQAGVSSAMGSMSGISGLLNELGPMAKLSNAQQYGSIGSEAQQMLLQAGRSGRAGDTSTAQQLSNQALEARNYFLKTRGGLADEYATNKNQVGTSSRAISTEPTVPRTTPIAKAEEPEKAKLLTATPKTATLDDVVRSLDRLNTNVQKMLQHNESADAAQYKSLRAIAGMGNLFNK